MNLYHDDTMDGTRRSATDWLDGGTEAAPLAVAPPARGPATESTPDPSWRAL